MARDLYAKRNGVWYQAQQYAVRTNGTWKNAITGHTKMGNNWVQFWPRDGGATPLPPGDYYLSATSSSIGSSFTAWALFNTAAFQGRITNVACGLAWRNATSYTFTIADRSAGAGSIARDKLPEYQDRLIYHNVAAASVTAINAGSSTGFTLTKPSGVGWDIEINYIRMKLTIV